MLFKKLVVAEQTIGQILERFWSWSGCI